MLYAARHLLPFVSTSADTSSSDCYEYLVLESDWSMNRISMSVAPAPKVRCRPSEDKSSNPTKRAKRASLPDSTVKSLDSLAAKTSSVEAPASATSKAAKTSEAIPEDLGANVLAAVVSVCWK